MMNINNKKGKKLVAILLIIGLLLGVGITVYPDWAAKYAESVRTEIQTEYQAVIEDPEQQEMLNALKEAAIEYNNKLYTGEISPLEPNENGYYDQLVVEGSDIMCYIEIPKINVDLPVYHGIGNDELGRGAGHMPQTSLPVGGINTHTVISAHSGMASSAMFSDLELLEVGDLVYITVLGERLTYQVYSIPEPVLPHEVEGILIQGGKDILTLVTCYPFGVNTHRLLVHCERIDTVEEKKIVGETVPAYDEPLESVYATQRQKYLTISWTIAIIIVLLAFIYVIYRRIQDKKGQKKPRPTQEDFDNG